PVEQVRIGLAVRARIDSMAEGPLLVFTAREEQA
ncbi:MAG: DNA-binding protein, partial [Proteobacteria bacterium]|nr:DNA-binding protein [Pseudomonadota bacterium]